MPASHLTPKAALRRAALAKAGLLGDESDSKTLASPPRLPAVAGPESKRRARFLPRLTLPSPRCGLGAKSVGLCAVAPLIITLAPIETLPLALTRPIGPVGWLLLWSCACALLLALASVGFHLAAVASCRRTRAAFVWASARAATSGDKESEIILGSIQRTWARHDFGDLSFCAKADSLAPTQAHLTQADKLPGGLTSMLRSWLGSLELLP